MVIAGVVIETQPGKAPEVAVKLAARGEVRLEGGDGDRRLAVVVSAASGEELERWAEELLRSDARVLGVFPTFVGEDEEGPQRAQPTPRGRNGQLRERRPKP